MTQYRQRAGTEWPRELRRHPLAVRYTLLAALCWQREREITDDLVELLIHIAHHVGVRAEEKVNAELMKYVKTVMGKAKLLYKLAKVVTAQPEGVVREVIYPVVSEETLEASFVRQKPTKNTSSKPSPVTGIPSAFGLGDINPSLFLSPANSGKLTWGVGPTLTFPTATGSALGNGKWEAGPALVLLTAGTLGDGSVDQ